MSDPVFFLHDVEGKPYVTINGRTSRVHLNPAGYLYTSWPGIRGTTGLHRILMSLKVGRRLLRSEHIHHKDGDRLNNTLDNLEIIDGRTHNSEHTRERNLNHDPDSFVCSRCERSDNPHKAWGMCMNCYVKTKRLVTAIRPCSRCGRETVRGKQFPGRLCVRCAGSRHSCCTVCNRSREDLPKSGTPIDAEGKCRACRVRLERHERTAHFAS